MSRSALGYLWIIHAASNKVDLLRGTAYSKTHLCWEPRPLRDTVDYGRKCQLVAIPDKQFIGIRPENWKPDARGLQTDHQ